MTPPPHRRYRLTDGWNPSSVTFLLVSITGLVGTLACNIMAVVEERNFLEDWFFSGPAVNSLGVDLFVVAVAGCVLIVVESRRLGMRFAWLYIAASGLTAFAFTFPLFLCMRERKLTAIRRADAQVS